MTRRVARSTQALLRGIVDYAGLFPPAGLALKPAIDHHATYAQGDDAWMLGCFVLPVAKMAEAAPLIRERFDRAQPARISALGGQAAPGTDLLAGVEEFVRACAGSATIDQFEMALPSGDSEDVENVLARFARMPWQTFWELPFSDELPENCARIARHERAAIKLRTGGVTPAAFPSPAQLADALAAARDSGVTLKFTAGLHHPVRHFNAEIGADMHGFLNVFAAAIFARTARIGVQEIRAILEDEDAENFRCEEDDFRWHDHRVTTAALTNIRACVTSFGSCSFDEPREDLRRLGILP